jgi:hypothetical protein
MIKPLLIYKIDELHHAEVQICPDLFCLFESCLLYEALHDVEGVAGGVLKMEVLE